MFDRRRIIAGLLGAALVGNRRPKVGSEVEGFATVPGGKVWWRKVGQSTRSPLLTLHGGPGAGHDYLTPLEALATQRPVVLYDQLGCGRSDKPNNPNLWNIQRFCDEVDALREHLGLDRVILYGHSWGGWLAQEYLARRGPKARVEALVLASTSASARQFVDGAHRLLNAMPGGVAHRMKILEERRQTEGSEYKALVDRFYDAHLIHMVDPPGFAEISAQNIATSRTYPIMNGPNEFTITGNLKNWDRTADLRRIHIPTLVITSSLDEFTIDCATTLHRGIAGSQLVVIPGARHLAMVEHPALYVTAMRKFLSRLA